jgi:hypothetical protein
MHSQLCPIMLNPVFNTYVSQLRLPRGKQASYEVYIASNFGWSLNMWIFCSRRWTGW